MLINIGFGFMMLIASLVELSIPKTPMWQKHNAQLANFDVSSLRVIWFRWGSLFGFRAFFAFGRPGVESRLSGLTRDTVIWYMNNNVHVKGASGPTLPSGWNLVTP
jgi:hypothetical protein